MNILLKKINVHNLKNISLSLPNYSLIVFTGISGSGKSSLAFDTIFLEGQRKYFDIFPNTKNKFIPKPNIESIEGLPLTIAIEQHKYLSKNPRSTVGTFTKVYDLLRILFSKISIAHCPISKCKIIHQTPEDIIKAIKNLKDNSKIILLSDFITNKKGAFKEELLHLQKKGFIRVRVDNEIYNIEDINELDATKYHTIQIIIDRLILTKKEGSRISQSINLALEMGQGTIHILDENNSITTFSQHGFCEKSKRYYPKLKEDDFSFNTKQGMCETCEGIGETLTFDLEKVIDEEKSLLDDFCKISVAFHGSKYKNIYSNLSTIFNFPLDTIWKNFKKKDRKILLYGYDTPLKMQFHRSATKVKYNQYIKWEGIINIALKNFENATSPYYKNKMIKLMIKSTCPSCLGAKLKPAPLFATINKKNIFSLSSLTLKELHNFLSQITLTQEEKIITKDLLKEILEKLSFLIDIGLDYITLNRPFSSLSGGEAQRAQISNQLSSFLIGACYILDEPSIGLHSQEHIKLISILNKLKKNNTIILVEHEKDIIYQADLIVDIGPKAGKFGGEIVEIGNIEKIINNKKSLTGYYLKNPKNEFISQDRRSNKYLTITGCKHNNLKNITVSFPLSTLITITGVSGSGKSSLISQTLFPALSNKLNKTNLSTGKYSYIKGHEQLDKVIFIDQSPIGRSIRSNPATYCKILDDIRQLYASLPESKLNGFSQDYFSFNVSKGTCPNCKGIGKVKTNITFLEDDYIECYLCNGKKFDKKILNIKYKNKNIDDVLQMDILTAQELFKNIPSIYNKLELLIQIGLQYLILGQPAPSLSGGEAQRIKLAKQLIKPNKGNVLYILDEPTTGLHPHDIKNLLKILQKLVDQNHTIIVIEHNLDFIKSSDWIIDIGPYAADIGGEVIGFGNVEKIKALKTPTALALNASFKPPLKKISSLKKESSIKIKNLNINNLQNINIEIPLYKTTCFTGQSASGKTSLAYQTLYLESFNRYIETLPLSQKQFFPTINLQKPSFEKIQNLPSTIYISHLNHKIKNIRATVGTLTKTYDLLSILYANLAEAFCPETKEKIKKTSDIDIVKKIIKDHTNKFLHILTPIKAPSYASFTSLLEDLNKKGFLRIRLNKKYYEIDEKIDFKPTFKNELLLVIDRMFANEESSQRFLESIKAASLFNKNEIILEIDKKDLHFNFSFSSEKSLTLYSEITPNTFCFNSTQGMCPECNGTGVVHDINFSNEKEILKLSINDLIKKFFIDKAPSYLNLYFSQCGLNTNIPLKNLEKNQLNSFFNGDDTLLKISDTCTINWKGFNKVISFAAKSANFQLKIFFSHLLEEKICPECLGERINKFARNVLLNGISISSLCTKNIKEILNFCKKIKIPSSNTFLINTFDQLQNNLNLLDSIGLSYLSLSRSSSSLSLCEFQKILLLKTMLFNLTECLYILDNPSFGIHPKEIKYIID